METTHETHHHHRRRRRENKITKNKMQDKTHEKR